MKKYRIRIKLVGTEGFLADEQHTDNDSSTFEVTKDETLAAVFVTKKAAATEVTRRNLNGLATVEVVP